MIHAMIHAALRCGGADCPPLRAFLKRPTATAPRLTVAMIPAMTLMDGLRKMVLPYRKLRYSEKFMSHTSLLPIPACIPSL